jgi:hypothetical protein
MADSDEAQTIRIAIDQEAFARADLERHASNDEAVFTSTNLGRVLGAVGPRFAPYVPVEVWQQISGAAVAELLFAIRHGGIGKPDKPDG